MTLCRLCWSRGDVWPPRPTGSTPRLDEGEKCPRCGRTREEEVEDLGIDDG